MSNNIVKIKASINKTEFKKLNDEFTLAKCYIMYVDENRNNNSIPKQAVEDALPSIYNTPVIGEFIEKKEDFGSHGGKIEIKDDEIKFIQTTVPYGVVPESCKPRWEILKDKNGIEKEYLTVDVILWTGRYSELEALVREDRPQSMEINVLDGQWSQDGVYMIEKFQFSALCILGSDVEPCFESSKIMAYSVDEFKSSLSELMKEYKKYISEGDLEGGEMLDTLNNNIESNSSVIETGEIEVDDNFNEVTNSYK